MRGSRWPGRRSTLSLSHTEKPYALLPGRLGVPTVDVDAVAHRLEGVEADPDRKDDAEWARRDGHAQVCHQVHELESEEVVVFVDALLAPVLVLALGGCSAFLSGENVLPFDCLGCGSC